MHKLSRRGQQRGQQRQWPSDHNVQCVSAACANRQNTQHVRALDVKQAYSIQLHQIYLFVVEQFTFLASRVLVDYFNCCCFHCYFYCYFLPPYTTHINSAITTYINLAITTYINSATTYYCLLYYRPIKYQAYYYYLVYRVARFQSNFYYPSYYNTAKFLILQTLSINFTRPYIRQINILIYYYSVIYSLRLAISIEI